MPAASPPKAISRRKQKRRYILPFVLVVAAVLTAISGMALRAITPKSGEHSGQGPRSAAEYARSLKQIATNPRQGFPGKKRINILCLGLDNSGNNNTDTIFVLSLDLNQSKVGVLSIPRDSWVHIGGTRNEDRINAAYNRGGVACAKETVTQLLGIRPDYSMVPSTDATKTLVDAVGGVEVKVEHAMDYDDANGNLHIHLKPGLQHLDGEQAVGFARFRHGNRGERHWLKGIFSAAYRHPNQGKTAEDGDQRRIYRQQVLLRALIQKLRSPSNLLQINHLLDVAMSCIRTDLSRTQLFDLAMLFRNVQQKDIRTAQLPAVDFRTASGKAVLLIDNRMKKVYVERILRGGKGS